MHYVLNGRIARAQPYQLDRTLTVEGAGADAKATGDAIRELKQETEVSLENALNIANNGVSAAGNAQTTADSALNAAENAQTTADNGLTTATGAQASAANAKTTADSALASATNAQATADKALSNATKALGLPMASIWKLWDNPSPNTEFVAIDGEEPYYHEDFDLFLVETQYSTTSESRKFEFLHLGEHTRVVFFVNLNSDTSETCFVSRTCKIVLNEDTEAYSISFGDCYKKTLSGVLTTDNTKVIPVALYGIKGVVE